ncbi:MAG TPA: monovalent cation/H+ antiporter subunit D [Burkholderiales bacterium]|nr:monovalent cation/H+ antiporter subunit D [Burkholderiales bacterium]
MTWSEHLIIAPVLLPLIMAAVMLLLGGDRLRTLRATLSVGSAIALVLIALLLLHRAQVTAPDGRTIDVYLLGNWPAPFGIVFVLDRLSAMMVLLSSVLGLATLVFALARWHRAGPHFHALFQLQLMGLSGAFLTGDLFNLFVFFEVMLAASYGLLLHGSGALRVRAGLHYVAINLVASLLFLIGVSMLYGVTGTLNMADMAARIAQIGANERVLMEAGAAILGVAFLVKAGMWPLGFWLPPAYSAAAAPVAALFSILSKVGVYAVLRVWLLLFGEHTGSSALLGGDWLLWGGVLTVLYGSVGVLASQDMTRLAGYVVLVSTGTLLAVIGTGHSSVTGSALYYLVSSTLAISAFFLLTELIERGRHPGATLLAVTMEAFGDDHHEKEGAGIPMPAPMAVLGISFVCCAMLLAGLPPLSGFIAKFAMLSSLLEPAGLAAAPNATPTTAWILLAVVIGSGLMVIIAMMRAGVRNFWAPLAWSVPRLRVIEVMPVIVLLLACAAMTIQAGPVMRYMQATAAALHAPHDYIRHVLSAPQVLKGNTP